MDDPVFSSPKYRARAEAVARLTAAIAQCHPHDAAQIMSAALENMVGDGPQHDVFGTLRRDAEWWAELAPVHEVQAYATAAAKQLGAKALGRKARKALLAALWNGMLPDDRAAFMRAVGAGK